VHILPVTFQAGEAAGKVERQLRISTDLGAGVVPAVTVQATVEGQPAEPAAKTDPQTSASAPPATTQAAALTLPAE
jgi:hypothetical protein